MKKILFAAVLVAVMSLFSVTQAHVLDDAKELNGHYYKQFEFKMTWSNAKKFCESMGGHLATIESDDENGIIRATILNGVNGKYWLGGTRDHRGVWKWITGKIIMNTNWDSDYPYSSENLSYLYIFRYNDKWANASNENSYSFICEWESKDLAHESNL